MAFPIAVPRSIFAKVASDFQAFKIGTEPILKWYWNTVFRRDVWLEAILKKINR